ncbi:MAG: hypothetical protein II916_03830 [Oscillospiraceae bacterium]|jgi:hypothetical protein|nr:hypothetical protein [Oscillospiraceae bacterium]
MQEVENACFPAGSVRHGSAFGRLELLIGHPLRFTGAAAPRFHRISL